jgi:hypothetical protein
MPLLYYWLGDNYRRDLNQGAGYHLNQANPLLHQIDLGDSLWAFTRRIDGAYVLAAELVAKAKTLNPPGYRYGRYRLWGDLTHSRYFQVDWQKSAEKVLRELSCRTDAAVLGKSFQGHAAVRRLNLWDHRMLAAASHDLPREPRARILPEERLEAALLLGSPETVDALVREESPGIAERRAHYLHSIAPARNQDLVHRLHDLYDGRCQVCNWNPRETYVQSLCHGHHLQWLSRGGEDHLENMVLVCPNHHAAIHRCDAPFDFADYSFVFADHREVLQRNSHLAGVR